MGMSYSAQIGPYVKVRVPVEDRMVDQCWRQSGCPNPTEGFCPKCGMDVSKRHQERKVDTVDLDELDEKYLDVLVSTSIASDPDVVDGARTYKFFGNQHFLPRETGWSRYDGEVELDFSKVDVAGEMAAFKEKYAEVLSYLEETAGPENVTYHWGFLTYYC